ncbi:MAG: 16S rRNA (adenine(1518)-N(6)/adenine(1519)-N(6))-dimethyltransferase RsmA [Flavobacteriales bacterium]|nr:16S rRNA (adenine(1518)-N(6)/adenine(1519)-N(6))-dimethyltransferase RsmA [Flavobacteriales bacterium]
MKIVKAKKHLGQHFLKDRTIATRTAESIKKYDPFNVLEIGPGMGMLTQELLLLEDINLKVVEIDQESVNYLKKNELVKEEDIIEEDFLKLNITNLFKESFTIIGNFPYNISTQIIFKTLQNRDLVTELVGMFQKEVGMRIASKPGNKVYGITSVLTQAFYDTELLFEIGPEAFLPPPKVTSVVIKLTKHDRPLNCNEKFFFQVVKQGFNQRRKMLSNALASLISDPEQKKHRFFSQRAEELSVEEFAELTQLLDRS